MFKVPISYTELMVFAIQAH